ncbi:MAG: hypothetical protein ABW184_01195 [Sphingobium sp.]
MAEIPRQTLGISDSFCDLGSVQARKGPQGATIRAQLPFRSALFPADAAAAK